MNAGYRTRFYAHRLSDDYPNEESLLFTSRQDNLVLCKRACCCLASFMLGVVSCGAIILSSLEHDGRLNVSFV